MVDLPMSTHVPLDPIVDNIFVNGTYHIKMFVWLTQADNCVYLPEGDLL